MGISKNIKVIEFANWPCTSLAPSIDCNVFRSTKTKTNKIITYGICSGVSELIKAWELLKLQYKTIQFFAYKIILLEIIINILPDLYIKYSPVLL